MTPALRRACARAVHVITTDGQVLRAGRATLFILARAGRPWLARVGALLPLRWLVELAYWTVARHRGFFGRLLFRH
jgi:predicted DCC family thiol-disulfide oxidoreductase YuxK